MNKPSDIDKNKNLNDGYPTFSIKTDMYSGKNAMPYNHLPHAPMNPYGESTYGGDNKVIFEI